MNKLDEILCEVFRMKFKELSDNLTMEDINNWDSLKHMELVVSIEEGIEILLKNIDYWRNAPVWTPETITEATRDWFKYLKK